MTRLSPALLLLLAFAPAAFGQTTDVDRLQELIEVSSSSRDPNIGFITGFHGWSDFALDQVEVREALARSGLPAGGPLHELLSDAVSISKEGRRVKIEAAHEHVFDMDGGSVKFKKTIEFDLTRGFIADIRDDSRRERLRDADPGDYTWINDVKNIQVSEGGGFYNLYDLYTVREHSGTLVAWIKAGKLGGVASRWARIAFEDDPEDDGAGLAEGDGDPRPDGGARGGALGALGEVAGAAEPVERPDPTVDPTVEATGPARGNQQEVRAPARPVNQEVNRAQVNQARTVQVNLPLGDLGD